MNLDPRFVNIIILMYFEYLQSYQSDFLADLAQIVGSDCSLCESRCSFEKCSIPKQLRSEELLHASLKIKHNNHE